MKPLLLRVLCVLCVSCLSSCAFKGVKQSDTAYVNRSGSWFVSYVCYVHGKADSIGCALVEASSERAARRQFHKENFGETCRVTHVEKSKP